MCLAEGAASKPSVKFEMELMESMQNQFGKQFAQSSAPGKLK